MKSGVFIRSHRQGLHGPWRELECRALRWFGAQPDRRAFANDRRKSVPPAAVSGASTAACG